MPSKLFQCDFCDSKHRKIDLPTHIRHKHKVDLAKYLVEDAKQSSISVISSYLRKADPKTMPIPSRIHEETDYWFGVKPVMIEEKDSVSSYLAMDVNIEAHTAFIKEIMDIVTLNDYIEIQRSFIIRSPEMLAMKDKVRDMEKTLSETTQQYEETMEEMRIELEGYRKTLEEVNDGILHKDLHIKIERAERAQKVAETSLTCALEQVSNLQWKVNNLEQRYEQAVLSNSESSGLRNIEMEESYMNRIDRLQKDKATLVASLEKEKAKNAKIKAKKAKTDRESQKRRELKERLKREEEELKAKKKALKKMALSDSDSNSDSDDDSSASSCDDE